MTKPLTVVDIEHMASSLYSLFPLLFYPFNQRFHLHRKANESSRLLKNVLGYVRSPEDFDDTLNQVCKHIFS